MKPKTLKWINPRDDIHMNDDSIPQILYRIQQIAVGPIYGVHFYHGYSSWELEGCIIAKTSSIEEGKVAAQNHWNEYVMTAFME